MIYYWGEQNFPKTVLEGFLEGMLKPVFTGLGLLLLMSPLALIPRDSLSAEESRTNKPAISRELERKADGYQGAAYTGKIRVYNPEIME